MRHRGFSASCRVCTESCRLVDWSGSAIFSPFKNFPMSISWTGAMMRLVFSDTQQRHQESPNLAFGPNTGGLSWCMDNLHPLPVCTSGAGVASDID